MDREEMGIRIIRSALAHADGYRRNISQFNTAHENEVAERCACAASNTAWFALKDFGFTDAEIKSMTNDAKGVSNGQLRRDRPS